MSRRILEELRRIANTRGRHTFPQFVVEGERINLRAVRAGLTPDKLVIAEESLAHPSPETQELLVAIGTRCEVVPVPASELIDFAQGRNSGRVVGVFPTTSPITLEHLKAPNPGAFLALVLVDIEEPGNVGALIRTALAGFVDVVVCVGVSDPFHPKAVRTSMGSLFRIPVLRVPDVEGVLDATSSYHRVAALAAGGNPPWELEPAQERTALFIGNEARGLPAHVSARIEGKVTIPMQSTVDSYSVNAATAILLYELATRRRR